MTETADKSTKRSFWRSWHLVFFSIATLLLIALGVVWLERNYRDDMTRQYFYTTMSQGKQREGEAEIRVDGSGDVPDSTQRIPNELTQMLSLVKKKRGDSKSHDPESKDKQTQAYEMEELQYIKMRKKDNLFPKIEAETKLKSIIKPPKQQDSNRKQMGMVGRGRGRGLKRSGRGRSSGSSSDSCDCDFSSGSSSKRSSGQGNGNSCACSLSPSGSPQPSLTPHPTGETMAPTVSPEPTRSGLPSCNYYGISKSSKKSSSSSNSVSFRLDECDDYSGFRLDECYDDSGFRLDECDDYSSTGSSSKKSSSSSNSVSFRLDECYDDSGFRLDECDDYSSTGSSDYTYSSTKASSRGRRSVSVDSSSNSRRVLGGKRKVRDFRNRIRLLK
jgi:hypothetical protein